MARIQGVPPGKQGLLARTIFGMARKRLGQVPEPMTVTAHHAKLFKGYVAMEFALDKSRLVDARLKLLAEIKVSTLIGCPF
ncbi:MAG TPA: hypothetical protein VGA40_02520 [Candidatus Acidoferrales bacterium]